MADYGSITLLPSTASAFDGIGIGDFYQVMPSEIMAARVLVLRELPDREDWFPHGKWGTIQSIETQLQAWAAWLAAEAVKSDAAREGSER